MKNLKYLFLFALVLGVLFACKKDDEEEANDDNNTNTELVEKSSVSAKWEVEGDSDYETFEFNESGTYVVVKNSPDKDTEEEIILFGTYTIDGDLLILSNFGTIKVITLTDEQISFAIMLLGEQTYGDTLIANRSEELPSSTNTQLLCRTWKLYSENGDTVAGTSDELYVVFYQSGTYVVTYVDEDEIGDIAQWKWYDSDEDVICYSWDGEPDCTDIVNIVYLDASRLEMEEEGYYYVLYPMEGTKSSTEGSLMNTTNNGNFLGK
jgi:hypothetical protein